MFLIFAIFSLFVLHREKEEKMSKDQNKNLFLYRNQIQMKISTWSEIKYLILVWLEFFFRRSCIETSNNFKIDFPYIKWLFELMFQRSTAGNRPSPGHI